MRNVDRIAYDVSVTLIGFVFVAARIYVRYVFNRGSLRSTVRAYVLSDVFMTLSWMCAACAAGLDISTQVFKMQKIGDKDPYNGPAKDPTKNLVWIVMNQKLYIQWLELNFKNAYLILIILWVALYFAKGSFLLFYWTTVRSLSRRIYRLLIGVTVVTAISFLVIMGLLLFTCFPVHKNWTVSEGSCMTQSGFNLFSTATVSAILHLTTHLALIFIGFLIVRGHITSLGQWEWFAVAMLFGLGIMVFTAHCIRYAVQMSISSNRGLSNIFFDYSGSRLETWMLVSALAELHICLIAIALPTLKRWLHQRKEQHLQAPDRSRGWFKKDGAKSAFAAGKEKRTKGMPRPPPPAMSFRLSALASMRSGGGGTMTRLSTTDSVPDHSLSGSDKQMTNYSSRSGRDKVIRVYGATESLDSDFERRGSVKIMNAEKF